VRRGISTDATSVITKCRCCSLMPDRTGALASLLQGARKICIQCPYRRQQTAAKARHETNARVNPSTQPFSPVARKTARSRETKESRFSIRRPQEAGPARAQKGKLSKLSVSNWRIKRPLVRAKVAVRTAASFSRAALRTSSKFHNIWRTQ